jgi:hypothetical protein
MPSYVAGESHSTLSHHTILGHALVVLQYHSHVNRHKTPSKLTIYKVSVKGKQSIVIIIVSNENGFLKLLAKCITRTNLQLKPNVIKHRCLAQHQHPLKTLGTHCMTPSQCPAFFPRMGDHRSGLHYPPLQPRPPWV